MRRCLTLFSVLFMIAARSAFAGPGDAPPADPAPGPAPKIQIDRTEHDFGTSKQNDKRATTFTVTNIGGSTLHVSVRSGAGCMDVSLAKKGAAEGQKADLEPGEAATLTLTFNTYRLFGPLAKSIYLTSDDPDARETAIAIRIDVSAGIVLTPPNFFFNAALVGKHPTSTVEVKWKEGVGKQFKITAIEPTNMIPASVKPDFDVVPFDAPPWHGYRVTMKFAEAPPIGMVTGKAMIRTDDAENAELSALIGGAVTGPVVISQRMASFGVVPEGKGGTLSIEVRPFDATISLGKVVATSRKGALRVKISAPDAPQGAWAIELELPKEAPVGPIEDVIDLTTEVRGEEKIEIPVTGTIVSK